jgi:predicted nucleic acid-binding protein
MSNKFLTQQDKIYLRSMKNKGFKVPQSKLKEIFKSNYKPNQQNKNKINKK